MTVSIRADRCIGCGMCAASVPEVFCMQGSISTVATQPERHLISTVSDAANGCPVNAIVLTRPAGG